MEIKSPYSVIVKPRGSICNLECRYCYYLSKERLYPGSTFRMTYEVLKRFIRQLIQTYSTTDVNFIWQGGEPTLMGMDFFDMVIALQTKFRKPGMKIVNILQTNGTTLDDRWCEFFKEHSFLIGISLDGPRELHDAFRRDKADKPTFEKVHSGVRLLTKHDVDFNILTCVSAANVENPFDVYCFLRDYVQAKFIQFIPIVEVANLTNEPCSFENSNCSITGEQYGQFLIAIFDEWVRRDVSQVHVQLFDNALRKWMGIPGGLCVFNETCGDSLVMEHNGDIYSCDHFVEPKHKLGNILETQLEELIYGEAQKRFGLDKKKTLPHSCLECDVYFACRGGCPKNRTDCSLRGELNLNHLCAGYKAFFNYIDQPMTIMANLLRQQRAPAEVMQILNRKI